MELTNFIKKMTRFGAFSGCILGLMISSVQAASCGGIFASDVTKEIEVKKAFHSLFVSGDADVFIKQGNSASLRIKAPKEVIEDLDIEVRQGKLDISPDDCKKEYTVYITMKDIETLSFSGRSDVTGETEFKGKNIKVKGSGSTKMKLAVHSNSLEFDTSGSSYGELKVSTEKFELDNSGTSDLILSGSAKLVKFDSSGRTDIEAFELIAQEYQISSSGSCDLKIHVVEKLKVSASGSCDIEYKGQPRITNSSSGGGSLTAVE